MMKTVRNYLEFWPTFNTILTQTTQKLFAGLADQIDYYTNDDVNGYFCLFCGVNLHTAEYLTTGISTHNYPDVKLKSWSQHRPLRKTTCYIVNTFLSE